MNDEVFLKRSNIVNAPVQNQQTPSSAKVQATESKEVSQKPIEQSIPKILPQESKIINLM